ncbi:MAG: transcriptional repressor [Candidatus Azobacteroides sp.]|nr:transcriptional repressor [Candidatus Azobacteroides sp.]
MNTKIEVGNRLSKFGVKPSLQRIAILEYLMEHFTHPTADVIFNDLYPSIPTLSKTTVYNTLKLLEEQGVIQAISIDEKNIRYDADISVHAHFKCKRCGRVYDFPIKDDSIFEIKDSEDFIVTDYQVYYKGYCRQCKDIIVQNAN